MEYAENIKKINLKGNKITDTGCENINKGLLNKKKLEYLIWIQINLVIGTFIN